MRVTGYSLREAIKQHELRRDTAARSFKGSLKAFPDDEKETPQAIVDQFTKSEQAIARLQVAQMKYNLVIAVEVLGEKITLAEAIKRVGGLGRTEKMWRTALGPKEDRYAVYDENVRDPNKVIAKNTIAQSDAVRLAAEAGKKAGAMRAAIAQGNGREVEIEDLDPSLFE